MAKFLIEMRPNDVDRYLGKGETILKALEEMSMLVVKKSEEDSTVSTVALMALVASLDQLSNHAKTASFF